MKIQIWISIGKRDFSSSGRDTSALISINLNDDDQPLSDFIEQMKQVQAWAIQKAQESKLEYDLHIQAEMNKNKTPSSLPEGAKVFWKKPALQDMHTNKKLQSNSKEYIAFDIRHDSAKLKNPNTNEE